MDMETKAITTREPTVTEPSSHSMASSIGSLHKFGEEEIISLLNSQIEELHASVLYYQSYLIGLVTVFSFVSAKLTPSVEFLEAAQLTNFAVPSC